MYDAKKHQVKLFHGLAEIGPEIGDERAVEIQKVADRQLDMRKCGCNMAGGIVSFGKREVFSPPSESFINGNEKGDHHQPAYNRVQK